MRLRTFSRIAGALALLLGAAGTGAFLLAPTAGGLEQDRIVLVPNGSQAHEYLFLIGDNAGTQADQSTFINEDVCANSTICDMVPMTVPDPGNDDDFFVVIRLTWESSEVPNVPLLGDTAVNDLDLYIQSDPIQKKSGPDEDGINYKSNGAAVGEVIQMYKPIGDWNIFVSNATGVNTGYKLTFEWRTDPIPTVFESFPPEFAETGTVTRPAPAPVSITPAAPAVIEEPEPLAAPVVQPAARPSLELASAPLPDASFSSGFGDAPSLADELQSPTAALASPAAAVKPAAPSTLALVLWMLALPLALLAAAAWYLNRKRSELL
jgi:hypothetical protein